MFYAVKSLLETFKKKIKSNMMKIYSFGVVIFVLLFGSMNLAACSSLKSTEKSQVATVPSSVDIPYIVARNYFVKNTVKEIPLPKIETKEEFDRLFGMAAVMGKNGKPTVVDFSTQYVIAVSKPVTEFDTRLSPVSLKRDGEKVVFTYQTTVGEKRSFTTVPFLLLVVSKEQGGTVVLNEVR